MYRNFVYRTALALATIGLVGCTSNTYQPAGSDMEHAVYAGKANYPYDAHSEMAVHLFSKVGGDTTIMIDNAGDEAYTNVELWVNKLYTLHVTKLDPKTEVAFAAKDIYNTSASNLSNVPPNTITSIQIFIPSSGKLMDVQGPILPH